MEKGAFLAVSTVITVTPVQVAANIRSTKALCDEHVGRERDETEIQRQASGLPEGSIDPRLSVTIPQG